MAACLEWMWVAMKVAVTAESTVDAMGVSTVVLMVAELDEM